MEMNLQMPNKTEVGIASRKILEEAYKIVTEKARYRGHPLDNLQALAKSFETVVGRSLTIWQVTQLFLNLKAEREKDREDIENIRDLIGYLLVYVEALEERKQRNALSKNLQAAAHVPIQYNNAGEIALKRTY